MFLRWQGYTSPGCGVGPQQQQRQVQHQLQRQHQQQQARSSEWPGSNTAGIFIFMKTYRNLWARLCTFEHLEEAYTLARKRKTFNPRVQEFDEHWRLNLCMLLKELRTKTYVPLPLRKFVLRDPKTRVICVSDFRDRVVHHALVNVLQPIFEPRFNYDSYASRRGKGVLGALKRFDHFKRQVSRNASSFGGGATA